MYLENLKTNFALRLLSLCYYTEAYFTVNVYLDENVTSTTSTEVYINWDVDRKFLIIVFLN